MVCKTIRWRPQEGQNTIVEQEPPPSRRIRSRGLAPVDDDPSESDISHPVDESVLFGPRDHALKNQLKLAGSSASPMPWPLVLSLASS